MDQRYNPNGSVLASEGITSPDGRVFGKMGHSERSGEYLYKNCLLYTSHCRHTTFGTILDDVQIDDAIVQKAFDRYMAIRCV